MIWPKIYPASFLQLLRLVNGDKKGHQLNGDLKKYRLVWGHFFLPWSGWIMDLTMVTITGYWSLPDCLLHSKGGCENIPILLVISALLKQEDTGWLFTKDDCWLLLDCYQCLFYPPNPIGLAPWQPPRNPTINHHQLAGFNRYMRPNTSLMFTNILFWQRGYHGTLPEFSHDIAYLIRITNHHIWWKTNHEKAWLVVSNFFPFHKMG